MKISCLLRPRLLALRNKIKKDIWKLILILLIGTISWFAIFSFSIKLLSYFKKAELIGDLILYRFLSMIILVFFSVLTLSNIIASLSNLLLSKDLEICHGSPCSVEEIFISRMILTVFDSSWMLVVFGSPIIMAYAWIYHPGIRFYLDLLHTGLSLIIISANIGIFITMLLANLLPAYRMREIFLFLGILLFVTAYLLFRFMRPERLVDPETFFTLIQYIKSLKAPDSPYIPSYWMCITLWKDLKGADPSLFNMLLLWTTSASLTVINIWIAEATYFRAYSKAFEAKRSIKVSHKMMNTIRAVLIRIWGRDMGVVMDKEIRIFFRDNTQWTQLILLGALVIVYIYNFKVLPLKESGFDLSFLQNEIAFFNIGFVGFLLSAISARFIFPSISAEGEAFWIIHSSPLLLRRFLWCKFLFYFPFMLVLGEALVIITNHLLCADTSIMILSIVNTFFMVSAIVSMAVGIGAIYPDFKHENIAQVATSIGALIYMILSFVLFSAIVLLQAMPAYWIFMSRTKGIPISGAKLVVIVVLFSISIFIYWICFIKPIQIGIRKLEDL